MKGDHWLEREEGTRDQVSLEESIKGSIPTAEIFSKYLVFTFPSRPPAYFYSIIFDLLIKTSLFSADEDAILSSHSSNMAAASFSKMTATSRAHTE